MKNKMGLELQHCGRCGGGGRHSWCEAYGDTCFGCGGTGVVLTKRGRAARAFWLESMARPADTLKPGEYMRGHNGGWLKVEAVEVDKSNKGHVTITTANCMHGMPGNSTVEAVKDNTELRAKKEAAKAYQDKLTKAGKLKKKHQQEG